MGYDADQHTEEADFAVFVLRCLLNYHERMMLGTQDCRVQSLNGEGGEFNLGDLYRNWSDGLKEAIRCLMLVHAGKIMTFPEWDAWVGIQRGKDPREGCSGGN